VTLNPERYECPVHQIDLTDLVEEALEDHGIDMAYGRPPLARKPRGPQPFQVIVTCPGTSGTGPHSLTCNGSQTR
jgi:hypothetical protein